MSWMEWLMLPIVGAAGGFLAGLLGVGGGLIFIPLLTWLLQKDGIQGAELVRYTLANSIFLVFVSGLAGIYKQHKSDGWNWKKAMRIGLPGAVVAFVWSYAIQHGNWYQKDRFQVVFLGFLLISILNMVFGKKETEGTIPKESNRGLELLVGTLAGTVVALSGLGGGMIMVPMFRMILKMPMRSASAMSLSIIPLLGIAPLSGYLSAATKTDTGLLQTGYIVWPYAIPIALGVAVFAGLGLKTAKHIPVGILRFIFALLSATIFIQIVYDLISHA